MRVETAGRSITLEEIPTDEFLSDFFNPEPGQHVVLIGPNGSGKTTLGMQLLARYCEINPEVRGSVLVMKPDKGPKSRGRRATGDPTVEKWMRKHGARVTRTWPPRKLWPWQRKPLYWVLWPKHTRSLDENTARHTDIFRRCLTDSYNDGDSVTFCDERAGLEADLDLSDELKQTDTRGRSMNAGNMSGSQRPRHIGLTTFTEGRHFFLHKMSDVGEYERLREIGGGQLDRRQIVAALSKLKRHQWLYLYPEEDIACVLV